MKRSKYSQILSEEAKRLQEEHSSLVVKADAVEVQVVGITCSACLTLRPSNGGLRPAGRMGSAHSSVGDLEMSLETLQDQMRVASALKDLLNRVSQQVTTPVEL